MIYDKLTDVVGNTSLLRVPLRNEAARLLLKLEKFNPGGSMKDRMAISMVDAAMRDGSLPPGGTIVESSSGNTGTGLAIAAAERGFRFIAVVDHHAAPDKVAAMRALGARIQYVSGHYAEDEVAVVERQRTAARIARELPGAVFMNQSDNPANPVGYAKMADEIIAEVGDDLTCFVTCAGTGGSVSGIGRRLKERLPGVVVVGVEPEGSIIFGGPGKPYFQSGTGTPAGDTVGLVMDYSVVDRGMTVSDQAAFETARFMARAAGLLVGGSTGGALYRALELSASPSFEGTIVCNVCDGGEKYLGTIFNDAWMGDRRLFSEQVWRDLGAWTRFPHVASVRDERDEAA